MWRKASFFLVENDPYFIFSIVILKFTSYETSWLEIFPQMFFCHFTIPQNGHFLAKTGPMIPGQTAELGHLTPACSWGWVFPATGQGSYFNGCPVLAPPRPERRAGAVGRCSLPGDAEGSAQDRTGARKQCEPMQGSWEYFKPVCNMF